jgi:hypothetical protein
VSDWLTITIAASGLKQRVRRSAISAYGADDHHRPYIVKDGHSIPVRETVAQLKAALEGDPSAGLASRMRACRHAPSIKWHARRRRADIGMSRSFVRAHLLALRLAVVLPTVVGGRSRKKGLVEGLSVEIRKRLPDRPTP